MISGLGRSPREGEGYTLQVSGLENSMVHGVAESDMTEQLSLYFSLDYRKKQGNSRKKCTSASLPTLKPLTVLITTKWKILQERNTRPPYLLLRNLYADQEATVRTGHGTTDWFHIGKGVH